MAVVMGMVGTAGTPPRPPFQLAMAAGMKAAVVTGRADRAGTAELTLRFLCQTTGVALQEEHPLRRPCQGGEALVAAEKAREEQAATCLRHLCQIAKEVVVLAVVAKGKVGRGGSTLRLPSQMVKVAAVKAAQIVRSPWQPQSAAAPVVRVIGVETAPEVVMKGVAAAREAGMAAVGSQLQPPSQSMAVLVEVALGVTVGWEMVRAAQDHRPSLWKTTTDKLEKVEVTAVAGPMAEEEEAKAAQSSRYLCQTAVGILRSQFLCPLALVVAEASMAVARTEWEAMVVAVAAVATVARRLQEP